MNKYVYITLLLISFLGVSCLKSDSDDLTCTSKVSLFYDWSHGKSIQPTDSVMIVAADGTIIKMKTDNVGFNLDLPSGVYTVMAYEPVPNVKITNNAITIGVDANGYAIEPTTPFSAGITTVNINGNASKQTLAMYYQTRELIVKVNFTGLGISALNSIEGVMSGIALSRKITDGFPPLDGSSTYPALVSGSVKYGFTATGVGLPTTKQFSGSDILLGLDGASSQILNLTLHFSGGDRQVTFDATQALSNFNTENVSEPFVIVINISISESFYADIINWLSGSLSEMDAH